MDLDDLQRIGDSAARSAFRLETLPQYVVPHEVDELARWRAGERPAPDTPDTNPWVARLKRDIDRGFRWYRVHILDDPLTDYLKWELYGLRDHQSVGAEVYVEDRRAHPDLAAMHEDFWLFDDETVVAMIYDDDGRFLHPERRGDLAYYRELRDTALRYSVPLDDYIARHPTLWSA